MRPILLICLACVVGCRSAPSDAPNPEATVEGPRVEADPACGAPIGTAVADPPPRQHQDPVTGKTVDAVGADLTGAPTVPLEDLAAHAGQRVRLEGLVTAMCVHRRSWFALRNPGDEQGTNVRVIATPAFLVPRGSSGRHARTEGTVELVDVPAEAARHYSRDHRLRGANNPAAAHRAAVLRATGAEFY